MLKTTRLSEKLALRAFRAGNNKFVESGNNKAYETILDLSKSKNKKLRKLTYMPNIGAMGKPNFLTPDAKKSFNHLRLAFIKALIVQHFDLESHIQIEINALSHAIGGLLN